MKAKLIDQMLEGYMGWDEEQCRKGMEQSLAVHIRRGKGQEVDIANLAMFLWNLNRAKGE